MKSHASMNRIYRLVWNQALGVMMAVAENAKGRGKSSTGRGLVAGAMALSVGLFLAPLAQAGPTGGQVSAGAATITQVGLNTTINQTSANLAINWQDFSVTANEAVRFNQPSATAVALNRVIGQNPSQILGSLSANGQVFVINPNGVLFGTGAQVNVGGLVASTLGLSDADLVAGSYTFNSYSGMADGRIVNKGTLTAAQSGYIALLAPEVRNEGVISATLGTALLAAGNKVSLNLNNGSLLSYNIDQGAVNALADNQQLIQADGGQVFMSATAANALTTAVVNNTGIVQAQTVQNVGGVIKLMGDMDTGSVNVAGTLDASAPAGGNGGFIETSAAHVKIANDARITTLAASGLNGTWLIDPVDFTIAANGGDITGTALGTLLASNSVTIQTATGTNTATNLYGGSGSNGDIFVNDVVSWSANTALTLNAWRNININQTITASGATGSLALQYGQGTIASGNTATYNINAPVNLQAGPNFSTMLGSDGTVKIFTVITSLGKAGSTTATDLQGMSGGLAGNYALGGNIDASATSGWNGGAGFAPIGSGSTNFAGNFDGLGHTISNLTIYRPTTNDVGLFGASSGVYIQNVGVVGGAITGKSYVGALVGNKVGTNITNA
ncbi:filamentous hemagglutinin N-terminal domain-containing protein [Rhodoferax sp. PAMC 29310]|uniref:two-partner secretion domain-containing protein n=1 Tax=Rhodoferax sp. PAMC 29310 TaxID=2822760 RepID=UPI001B31E2FC|nr:filamentous hemagglutinin N-terminal domain-containing protein [Rhodoferax sp. PAMC 29310]